MNLNGTDASREKVQLQERLRALDEEGRDIHGTIAGWWTVGVIGTVALICQFLFHSLSAMEGGLAGGAGIVCLAVAITKSSRDKKISAEAMKIRDRLLSIDGGPRI